MFWRPLQRGIYKPWWATAGADRYGAAGLAARLIADALGGILFLQYANDRDHLQW
jgi:hypothetical protein